MLAPRRQVDGVNAKTADLLYSLLWVAEMTARPTFRNLTGSFEGWAYRGGLQQRLAALEKAQWLESQGGPLAGRVHRLTAAGRQLARGGCDPVARWNRGWDGTWRMILFDLPQKQASTRARLRRSLAERGFGFLQNSVWITPDPLTNERESLGGAQVDVESLLFLEARPCAGETDLEIVNGAWDFAAINAAYNRTAAVLDSLPRTPCHDEAAARRLQRWLREERLAWLEVTRLDPFLPQPLHPPGYRGMAVWQRRLETMTEAGRQMRTFRPPG